MNAPTWLLVGIGLVVTGCHPEPCCGPPPPPTLNLRAGVTVLDSVPTNRQVQVHIGISDVARDGAWVAVLVWHGCNPVVFVSNDTGHSWTRHTLPSWPGCGLEPPPAWIHIRSGNVTLIALVNQSNPYFQFNDVDLTSDTYKANDPSGNMRPGFLYFAGDRIISYNAAATSSPPNGTDYYALNSYSLTTKTTTITAGDYTAPATDCRAPRNLGIGGPPWISPDGHTFMVFCYAPQPVPSWCEIIANTSVSLVPTTACVPLSQWPPEQADPSDTNFFHRQYLIPPSVLAEEYRSGNDLFLASLASLVPAAVAPSIDLGAGVAYDAYEVTSHQAYDGMIPLGQSLIRLQTSGPHLNVPIPPAACVGLNYCGTGGVTQWAYGQVAWLVPLGNDDYLVFYVFYRGDVITTNVPDTICVSLEHAPPTAL